MNTAPHLSARSTSLEQTSEIARQWLEAIAASPVSASAIIIGLDGNLGSGKTTFTQAVARELGVAEQVTSPTYVIQKSYAILNPRFSARFSRLIHIDAYRLEEASELEVIGFRKLAADPRNLILIEWPERVAALLPADMRTVHFAFVDETTRSIEY
ncbi:MAG: hypothetical protein JWO73_896 [Candidatus Taylorbacteria bacterium]|nr:hypothetical protein [Candidatus Taylorbacteria bacterium]